MKKSWLLSFGLFISLLVSIAATGCLSSGGGPPSVVEYKNVAEVVTALDKHTLSNGDKPYYELISAYDGMKYDVAPGGYRLEIYVYRDLKKMQELARQAETIDNQVHAENNVMLLLHTTDKAYLDSLLADLRD